MTRLEYLQMQIDLAKMGFAPALTAEEQKEFIDLLKTKNVEELEIP